MNKFLANREFTKYIKHNKKLYKLNSVFDNTYKNFIMKYLIKKYKIRGILNFKIPLNILTKKK